MMKRSSIDAAFIGLLALLALASILSSATGGERIDVLVLAFLLASAATIVGGLLIGYRRYTGRRVMPALVAPLACLALIVSVAVSNWPLRITVAAARDRFESLAQQLRAGEAVETPLRAGIFTIRGAELSEHGIVCLWTSPDPSGSKGFVQCGRDFVPFNLWSHTPLDGGWQLIAED